MILESSDKGVNRMNFMIKASLLLNIGVLIPVCGVILTEFSPVVDSWGEFTPARGILLSIYLAILGVSTALLFIKREPMLVAPLFLVQVIYKFTTPLTVGSFTNPVVISNIFIATFHLLTLRLIYPHLSFTASNNVPSSSDQYPSNNVPML